MNLFKTPESNFSSYQEKAKFNFVWRINFVFSIVGLIMTGYTFLIGDRFFIYYSIVFFITISSLIFLNYLKAYRQVSKVLFLTVCFVLGLAMFSVPESLHLQEALWMVVLILSAFFTLGNIWGIFYLVINTIFYCIYYNYIFKDSAHFMISIKPNELFVLSVEFCIAMFLIGFVMIQYGLVIKQAVKNTSDAYDELKTEKQIVEHQNKEKTILLQEIHHRVKNNLQVIVSLLRLQSREMKSEEAKESFDDSINRILTMSLIHQKLYEKDSLMNIDIKDYLNTLIKNLIETGTLHTEIVYNVNSTLKSVSAKGIVPLGLIINELVSNSMKHAFDKTGCIELTLTPGEGRAFLMTYFDNGKWKENSENTFGTQLIEVFTEQLEGSYKRIINDLGTHFYFHLMEEES